MSTLPNFIVIGAGKAGTTALDRHLANHPAIFMSPIKEPCFFCHAQLNPNLNRSAITSLKGYAALFKTARDETAIGETSPQYLARPGTAQRIHALLPGVRLIAILRNPIDRAFSLYTHFRRDGFEKEEDFGKAIYCSPFRWHYVDEGFYARALERYYAVFPAHQIRVYLYEDFCKEPRTVLEDIFAYLGVDAHNTSFTETIRNVSGLPQNALLKSVLYAGARPTVRAFSRRVLPAGLRRNILGALHHWIRSDVKKVRIPENARYDLSRTFEGDVKALSLLLGRDLSQWTPRGYNRDTT